MSFQFLGDETFPEMTKSDNTPLNNLEHTGK